LGRLLTGSKKTVLPCTPKGIVQLLKDYQIPLQGQHVVVVGRSLIVGKPAGLLFLQENATVTFAHSKTQDLRHHLQQADIAIIAAGSVGFLSAADFKKGAVLIDVGIHRVQDRWMGDVNPEGLQDILSAASPVPGGVGPMTITSLLENTLLLAQRRES
jgi:methylenetetrahydrofolate dehydrogenase (NADP+)/methenyltetrahydrofolate cyclohydrolase